MTQIQTNCRKHLEGMVDDHIISKLEAYQSLASVVRIFGADPRTHIPTNFVFKGPPGYWSFHILIHFVTHFITKPSTCLSVYELTL